MYLKTFIDYHDFIFLPLACHYLCPCPYTLYLYPFFQTQRCPPPRCSPASSPHHLQQLVKSRNTSVIETSPCVFAGVSFLFTWAQIELHDEAVNVIWSRWQLYLSSTSELLPGSTQSCLCLINMNSRDVRFALADWLKDWQRCVCIQISVTLYCAQRWLSSWILMNQ